MVESRLDNKIFVASTASIDSCAEGKGSVSLLAPRPSDSSILPSKLPCGDFFIETSAELRKRLAESTRVRSDLALEWSEEEPFFAIPDQVRYPAFVTFPAAIGNFFIRANGDEIEVVRWVPDTKSGTETIHRYRVTNTGLGRNYHLREAHARTVRPPMLAFLREW